MKSIIIAAPHSGSGKTTITLGIMACLKRRGLKVAPFKVGPDFIDPGYHRLVCARHSVNLDGWMCPPGFVRETFCCHSAGMDIAVIEGVMGLFDGISGASDEGSTAQAARITGSPVILVVDARSQGRSAAALIKGFLEFDAAVKVTGVIFNRVAGENHARILREAVADLDSGTQVLGFIPRDDLLQIPSRHLGLVTAEENPLPAEFIDHLAGMVRDRVDLDLFLNMATPGRTGLDRGKICPSDQKENAKSPDQTPIALARDEAFCFVYEDNLRLLREAGGEIVEFSPLRDRELPKGIGGIYFPGGYPEVFAEALADNHAMKSAVREAIEAGMPVYGECGGFIYLTQGLPGMPFVGVFPVTTRMLPRRKALGYREIRLAGDTIIGRKGSGMRGHEFHFSEMEAMPTAVARSYHVAKSGNDLGMEGYRYKNCLASYIHLHFGSNPETAAAFVGSCRKFKSNKLKETE